MTTTERVREILKAELNLGELPLDASNQTLSEWDSLTYMSIVTRIEDEFSMVADASNIQKFTSLESIVKLIDESKRS